MVPPTHALLLAALAAVVLYGVILQTVVDPWHDEAMLVANLLVPDLSGLSAMPLYEQAAPAGYVWMARLILKLTGGEPPYHALRLLSVGFVVAGIAITLASRSLRHDRNVALGFLALLLVSPLVWKYAGEIKHYSAEFFASALVLAFAWPLMQDSRGWNLVGFVTAVAIGSLFSFTLPVIVAGAVAAIASLHLMQWSRNGKKGPALPLGMVATAILCVVGVAALQVMLNRSLVTYQMSAYSYVYGGAEGQRLLQLLLSRMLGLLDVFTHIVGPTWLPALRDGLIQFGVPVGLAYHGIRLAGVVLGAALLVLAWRRSVPVAVTVFFTLAALSVLILAGQVSMPFSRHIMFLLPLTATMSAMAVVQVAEMIMPRPMAGPIMVGVMTICIVSGGIGGLARDTQQITPLLNQISAIDGDAPVWIYGGAQPAVSILEPRPSRVLGEFEATSGTVAWQVRGGEILDPSQVGVMWKNNPEYPASLISEAAGENALWLIFSHDGFVPNRTPFVAAAERAVGPCTPQLDLGASALYRCTRLAVP
jgi:hypothetical protein